MGAAAAELLVEAAQRGVAVQPGAERLELAGPGQPVAPATLVLLGRPVPQVLRELAETLVNQGNKALETKVQMRMAGAPRELAVPVTITPREVQATQIAVMANWAKTSNRIRIPTSIKIRSSRTPP